MKVNTIDVVERLRSERFEGGIAQWIATMREAADTIERLRAELAEAYEKAAKVADRRFDEVSDAAKDCGRPYLFDVEAAAQRSAHEIAKGIRAMIAAAEGGE